MSSAAKKPSLLTYKLKIYKGSKPVQSLKFHHKEISIGRDPKCQIQITDDRKISRRHAKITQTNGKLFVFNLSKTNGLKVDKQVKSESELRHGSLFQIGNYFFHVILDESAPSPKPQLELMQNQVFTPRKSENKDPQRNPSVPQPHPQPIQAAPAFPATQGNRNIHPNQPLQTPMNNNGLGAFNPRSSKSPKQKKLSTSNLNPIHLVIGAVVCIGLFMFLFPSKPKSNKVQLSSVRTQSEIELDFEKSRAHAEAFKQSRIKQGKETEAYKSAQAHYIKGFRDYRNGQYSQALQSFQAALALFPNHTLAKRYSIIAKRKHDELIQYNLLEGRQYLERGNYTLCADSFRKVIFNIKDKKDRKYQEAKEFLKQCEQFMEDRY